MCAVVVPVSLRLPCGLLSFSAWPKPVTATGTVICQMDSVQLTACKVLPGSTLHQPAARLFFCAAALSQPACLTQHLGSAQQLGVFQPISHRLTACHAARGWQCPGTAACIMHDGPWFSFTQASISAATLFATLRDCVCCCCVSCSTYNAVARDFPLSARQVLENLKCRAQEVRRCTRQHRSQT